MGLFWNGGSIRLNATRQKLFSHTFPALKFLRFSSIFLALIIKKYKCELRHLKLPAHIYISFVWEDINLEYI